MQFWQTVRRLRESEQYSTHTVHSGDGALVTSVLVGQWKEYFKDPYRKLNLGIRGKTPTLIHYYELCTLERVRS